jgi:adenylate kinase
MKIVILGPPSCGKGTQGKIISKDYGLVHISTGEILRQLADEGNPLGVEARDKYWGHGNYVPDNVITNLVRVRLSKEDCKKGYVLEGYPRTVEQAKSLENISKPDYFISLECKVESILKRTSARRQCKECSAIYGLGRKPKKEGFCDDCNGALYQRKDDKPEIVKNRLTEFEEKTNPVLSWYEEKGLLTKVNGDQQPEKVSKDIINILKQK